MEERGIYAVDCRAGMSDLGSGSSNDGSVNQDLVPGDRTLVLALSWFDRCVLQAGVVKPRVM
jgi:hypothetical protein